MFLQRLIIKSQQQIIKGSGSTNLDSDALMRIISGLPRYTLISHFIEVRIFGQGIMSIFNLPYIFAIRYSPGEIKEEEKVIQLILQ